MDRGRVTKPNGRRRSSARAELGAGITAPQPGRLTLDSDPRKTSAAHRRALHGRTAHSSPTSPDAVQSSAFPPHPRGRVKERVGGAAAARAVEGDFAHIRDIASKVVCRLCFVWRRSPERQTAAPSSVFVSLRARIEPMLNESGKNLLRGRIYPHERTVGGVMPTASALAIGAARINSY